MKSRTIDDSMKPLPQSFFNRPTLDVARELLGCELWVQHRRSTLRGRLVEVEAYIGEEDPSCHAHRGRTPKTETMYGPPGMAYVYFTYGNHWMLNFVTERRNFPAAVLIRGIEPLDGIAAMRRRRMVSHDHDLTNGPGKITDAFGITGDDNGVSLRGPRLVVTKGTYSSNDLIATSGRVGVGEGHERPWRFFFQGNPWVSKYRFGTKSYLKTLQSSRAA